MKKCLIIVDFFKDNIESFFHFNDGAFKSYIDDRISNLSNLIGYIKQQDNFDMFYHQYGNQEFYFDTSDLETWNFTDYDVYYFSGLSMTQCVHSLYCAVPKLNKYIVSDCCIQEVYTGDTNYDHPNVDNIEDLVKFENDWLNGKIRFMFFDNSSTNDGRGEWKSGDFEKVNYITSEEMII
jgi:hypothetical protein